MGVSPTVSLAAPPASYYDLPEVVAVQDRPYYLNHDLTFQAGALPSDAFNKGYTVGTSYTYFFSDYLAWEVINLNYNFNAETGLKDDIEGMGSVVQNKGFDGALDYITYFATTNVVYTPLYNKSLLFNRSVINGETSFVFGGGAAHFKENGLKGLISGGILLRFFNSPRTSFKFDLRNNLYFEDSLGAVNAWSIMIGYSVQLGAPPQPNSKNAQAQLQ